MQLYTFYNITGDDVNMGAMPCIPEHNQIGVHRTILIFDFIYELPIIRKPHISFISI